MKMEIDKLITEINTSNKKIWEANYIKKMSDCNLDVDENVIVHEIPFGKQIEILYDNKTKDFLYTLDAKTEGDNKNSIAVYLYKNIYPKLSIIVKMLFNQTIHFYGFIGKTGFEGTDIFVNYNWLDWDLLESLYKEVYIKTPKVKYIGLLESFTFDKKDNFILRRFHEPVNKRQIYYLKST